ncbi:VOC family protein [Paractinoplanes toevensis]|uniref:VOC family protein n=1 Tax=Paractinoplanes toevensis TaxID=571911 RepID=UPI001BB44DD5|nr:hypothetical protein [Actinoplanes toevensis]
MQLPVGDIEAGRRFYATLFAREPDFAPHDDFLEWRVESELGVAASPVTTLPGVVSFINFEDPWGNRLGYYEDIVPSEEQQGPGGSTHDESLFDVENP